MGVDIIRAEWRSRDRADDTSGTSFGESRAAVWRVVVMSVLLVTLAAAGGGSAIAQSSAGAESHRVALVVGNDLYQAQAPLRNAANDARAVAAALADVGFDVTTIENANRARLTSALGEFARSLRDDDIALFYFAGHGVQVEQENYLIPTDYTGQTASALRLDAVSASDVEDMLRVARVAMLVFDACRNNPYRGVRSGGTGLAPMEARGTLIAYAAGAGEVAADAAPGASNGLFTSKFVEALAEPGLTATELFRRVRRDVLEDSNEEQWPAVYDNLLSDFVFRPTAAGVAGATAVAPLDAAPPAVAPENLALLRQQETVFWESIRDSQDPADFEAILRQFGPNGTFARLARNRLRSLRVTTDPAPPPAAPPAAPAARPVDPPDPRESQELLELRLRLAEAEARLAEAEAARRPRWPTDDEWDAALPRATQYGRPDRTSEGDLNDGSHYDQSSDDRTYREYCGGTETEPGVTGFNMNIRSNTRSIHWRWKATTRGQWRAYYNGRYLGPVGGGSIRRVADTMTTWHEYEPPRNSSEAEFVILSSCRTAGTEELEIHYHH